MPEAIGKTDRNKVKRREQQTHTHRYQSNKTEWQQHLYVIELPRDYKLLKMSKHLKDENWFDSQS
jgi:hypothetical protein